MRLDEAADYFISHTNIQRVSNLTRRFDILNIEFFFRGDGERLGEVLGDKGRKVAADFAHALGDDLDFFDGVFIDVYFWG